MENQHRKISGYRELRQEEIDLMNEIKAHGPALQSTLDKVHAFLDSDNAEHGSPDAEPRRWAAIAKTDLQTGLMALTRAIARPTFF